MRTFDEAVKTAFAVKRMPDPEQQKQLMEQVGEAQQAFQDDILANPVVMAGVEDLMWHLIREIGASTVEEEVPRAVMNCLMTTLQWGLIIGRKMEEPELTMLEVPNA